MLAPVNNSGLSGQSLSAERREKLEHAAHQFEASLMAELLKPMQQPDAMMAAGNGGDEGSGGALQDFASESLARAISDHGGFGIASQILRHLEPSQPIAASSAHSADVQNRSIGKTG